MTAPAKPEQKRPPGRPPKETSVTVGNNTVPEFNPEQAAEVIRLVEEGSNLEKIGNDSDNGLPSKTTLYAWRKIERGFENDYARARERRADARADRIDDISQRVEDGDLTPQQGHIMFRAETWQAARENPKVYGDKTIHEGGDTPIRTENTNKSLALAVVALLQDSPDVSQTLKPLLEGQKQDK